MIIAGIIILVLLGGCFFYASYSIRAGVYLKAICRIKTSEKIVALTFDDGPHPTQTPKVLDVLKEKKIPATFFCIGDKIAGNEEILRRMTNEGHHIGNHSYSHTWRFPLLSRSAMLTDLKQCEYALEEATHQTTNWFRPPFGVTNPTVANAVKKLNYQTIGWNIRTLDTQTPSAEKIIARIKKQLKPGSIILLHDRMPDSEQLLKKILDLLEAEHYKVVSLKQWIN